MGYGSATQRWSSTGRNYEAYRNSGLHSTRPMPATTTGDVADVLKTGWIGEVP